MLLYHDPIEEFKVRFPGDIRTDITTRLLYSTDASIYQIEPLGVAFPRSLDELASAVEIAATLDLPLLARGAGSSLAGQAIGPAIILDCSRYLTRLIEINPEEGTALVEPGLILANLNRAAASYNLQFGPDPASGDRATMGGCIANNASGAHSILYGLCVDHLLSAEVVLSNGSVAVFEEVTLQEAEKRAVDGYGDGSIQARLYRVALSIKEQYTSVIQKNWPLTWRRVSGYNLNYLLPWSSSIPPLWEEIDWFTRQQSYPPIPEGHINLAHLLAGSEGTLAIIRQAKVRLVPSPPQTILGILPFDSIGSACDAVPEILESGPSAVELIPQSLIRLARSIPAYAHQISFIDQFGREPIALLVVEYSGNNRVLLFEKVKKLGENALLAESLSEQARVWAVRKVGLGILMSRRGDRKPIAFIEDVAVPVERLGTFVREVEYILSAHDTQADFYAHASAGCLHIRPLLNLKTKKGRSDLRSIAEQVVRLALSLGGAVSAEHGDGLARGEWLEWAYGPEIMGAFRELKLAADPRGLLNPGKIIDVPSMDTNLRYGEAYQANSWEPVLDFSRQGGISSTEGFVKAVEQCNGAGVCRKLTGVMCPSFQATQDEMHSTRGRANLLRAMISGQFSTESLAEQAVYEAMDLCLACKGCKSECPSAVDMAKLKYEVLNKYYTKSGHRRPLRDYLFAYFEVLARFGYRFAPYVNKWLDTALLKQMVENFLGLSKRRSFPRLAQQPLHELLRINRKPNKTPTHDRVFLLSDAFTEYIHPEVGLAAINILSAVGYQVLVLPVIGAGRTLISKGFLHSAKKHAQRLVKNIVRIDPGEKIPVIGLEPSEIYTLRDEYLDLLPNDPYVSSLVRRAYMIDEYLVRPGTSGASRISHVFSTQSKSAVQRPKVLLHGHCYQKSQPPAEDGYPTGVDATARMLETAGYSVQVIEGGCCGMAGAFGYEKEHYDISMRMGEHALFPVVRSLSEDLNEGKVVISAAGISCQTQIMDGTGQAVLHPMMLLSDGVGGS